MVDMNVIILEGIVLYIAIAIVLLMAVAIAVLALSGIKQDEEKKMLNAEVTSLKISNAALNREIFRYKLKYGELDVKKDCHTAVAVPGDKGETDVRNNM